MHQVAIPALKDEAFSCKIMDGLTIYFGMVDAVRR